MSDPNNVIKFPLQNKKPAPKDPPPRGPDPKKIAIPASLVSVFVLSLIINSTFFGDAPGSVDQSSVSRGIASVQGVSRDAQWEQALARELAGGGRRGPASVGQPASLEEKLRYGEFATNYQMRFSGGKIREIELLSNSEPSYLEDRSGFLADYRELMPVAFTSAEAGKTETSSEAVTETYRLLDANARAVGEASFRMDRSGRLLSLSVERSTETAE